MKTAHLLIMIILLGCSHGRPFSSHNNPGGRADVIENFDLSPDDQKVLVVSSRDGACTMFEVNAEGRSPRLILKPSGDEIFSSPRYSPDGTKIVFIKQFKKTFWESTVCIANADGTGVRELTRGGELVTEAIISARGDVLYCSSKQYNSSKTKGTTDAHKFGIYAIDVGTGAVTKLTKIDALGIDNLSEINAKYIVFHMTAGNKSGIYSFERENPSKVVRLFPANGTQESSLLDKPGYAPDKFLLFTAVTELYAMNMTTREADVIYDSKGGHRIQLLTGFHTKSRVMFKKFDEQSFTSLNTDGTDALLIDVEFPE